MLLHFVQNHLGGCTHQGDGGYLVTANGVEGVAAVTDLLMDSISTQKVLFKHLVG